MTIDILGENMKKIPLVMIMSKNELMNHNFQDNWALIRLYKTYELDYNATNMLNILNISVNEFNESSINSIWNFVFWVKPDIKTLVITDDSNGYDAVAIAVAILNCFGNKMYSTISYECFDYNKTNYSLMIDFWNKKYGTFMSFYSQCN